MIFVYSFSCIVVFFSIGTTYMKNGKQLFQINRKRKRLYTYRYALWRGELKKDQKLQGSGPKPICPIIEKEGRKVSKKKQVEFLHYFFSEFTDCHIEAIVCVYGPIYELVFDSNPIFFEISSMIWWLFHLVSSLFLRFLSHQKKCWRVLAQNTTI